MNRDYAAKADDFEDDVVTYNIELEDLSQQRAVLEQERESVQFRPFVKS